MGPSTTTRRGSRLESRKIRLLVALVVYCLGILTGTFWCSVLHLEDTQATSHAPMQFMHNSIAAVADANSISSKGGEGHHHIRQPMELFQPSDLKLPTPIIVMGMMKAGTTSIYGYFRCGLDPKTSKLSHYDCRPGKDPQKIGMACGKRIRRNLTKMRRAAFDSMDNFTLYAEIDGQEMSGGMTLPQWDYIEQIYEHFPSATWILNVRSPEKWLNSVDRWLDLRQRFIDNPYLPDLPRGVGRDDKDMIRFYLRQAERIREFCASHPSLSCVEVPIDSPDAGAIMEEAFGIPKQCYGNRNSNNGTAIWSLS